MAIVPFEYDALTLDNIKKASKNYFDVASYMKCDMLDGERGPSYTSIDQIKNLKLLHVRFYFNSKVPEVTDGDKLDDKPSCSFSSDSMFRSNKKKRQIEKVFVEAVTKVFTSQIPKESCTTVNVSEICFAEHASATREGDPSQM